MEYNDVIHDRSIKAWDCANIHKIIITITINK